MPRNYLSYHKRIKYFGCMQSEERFDIKMISRLWKMRVFQEKWYDFQVFFCKSE